ncbi:hypothetical protein [Spirilliplanes yamanashiensis]|uniref:Uncharacterized protein n=1 Tax=Spirilliplanes yamanashiensis TaxID=42233 RepID=A0A8J4DK30_9ACTN|nr:hypothetical protein [Spirilliplanes yamanashiensis]MDP9815614.1 hypothetical protein [Spirilliplanes yamanashiensis]GIJ03868.1 hypothetical protein Sya03_32200 [Spirilliplanes yamanashiensis]
MAVLHETYLPFPAEILRRHFAPVRAPGDHLAYYRASVANAAAHDDRVATGHLVTDAEVRRGRQLEKDERFWVAAALLGLYYGDDDGAGRSERFAELLARAGVAPPPGAESWAGLLAGELHLYLEVALPSPPSYRRWLADHLDERTPIPYLRTAAARRAIALEGATRADAMLVAPATGAAVLFEAKVLSDVSTTVTYDVLRNQLARCIDVLLDPNPGMPAPLGARDPDRSCVVLLTPELYTATGGRLYNWLLPAYRDPRDHLLQQHLPHRTPEELRGAAARLGWATWEDCDRIAPGACPWLSSAGRA